MFSAGNSQINGDEGGKLKALSEGVNASDTTGLGKTRGVKKKGGIPG